ncbi:MAG: glycosyltransferase [Gammaproteobacteria bacterium]|nr:glycosyltransferase [Gammaproteobacteria bacterium]
MSEPSGKPRLLVLTTTFPRWPDDHEPPFVFELARRLTDAFDITVLAPHAPGAAPHEEMAGLDVHRFRYAPDRLERLAYDGGIPSALRRRPWLALLVPTFVLAQLLAALRLVRAQPVALIHAHWLLPAGLVGAVLKELLPGKRRLLVTSHGADLNIGGSGIARWLKRLAVESADSLTVVSRALHKRASPLLADHTTVEIAPMGVDLQSTFTPGGERPQDPVVIFVGRLVEKKGARDLITAMPAVLRRFPAARLLVVGHGPLEDALRSQAAALDIADAVDFAGHKANHELPDILRHATLAALPFCTAADGDVEGLGLTAVEALGCGLPVIVGDVPAVHDVVRHGETGWIVPPRQPDALADAILHLLENPDVAETLARKGRAHSLQTFDWEPVSAGYRTRLQRLLN